MSDFETFYYPDACVSPPPAIAPTYSHVSVYDITDHLMIDVPDLVFANGITGLMFPAYSNAILPNETIEHIKSYCGPHLRSINRRCNLTYGGRPCLYCGPCKSNRLGVTRHVECKSLFELRWGIDGQRYQELTMVWGYTSLCRPCEAALRGQADLIYHRLRVRTNELVSMKSVVAAKSIKKRTEAPDYLLLGQCLKCKAQVWLYDKASERLECANCWCIQRMNDCEDLPGMREYLAEEARKIKRQQVEVIEIEDDS